MFAELKRRNVLRAATFYAASAWLIVQVATQVFPFFHVAEWVVRWIVVAAAIGFPFAMLFSWFYEWTPQGIQRESDVVQDPTFIRETGKKFDRWIIAVLAVAVVLLLANTFIPHRDAASAATPERSIAVLPFVNMSGDPKNEYFSDGLAETTLDMLAQVPDLKVIARTSSFAFKGKSQDMRQIGAALGAANLLEGSVQQAGDTLRITVQLIKAADGSHLWSHHYDRPMGDVFKIQDEIATHVVQELEIVLPAKQQKRLTQKRTDNVAAFDEYTRGLSLMPGRKVADMRLAVQHFERAIVLDPNYARAYVAASDAYRLLDEYGTITQAERARGKTLLDRALALAPDLGEAHISLAYRLERKDDLIGAEREFRRGIALAPSYATGYQWYSLLLNFGFGRAEEARTMAQRAAALDPLSPIVQLVLIDVPIYSGRFKEAETLLSRLHAEHPEFAMGYWTEAVLASMQGDLVGALRAMREHATHDPGNGFTAQARCTYLERFGALDQARRCLENFSTGTPESPNIQLDRALLKIWASDWTGALTQIELMAEPNQTLKASLLTQVGRYSEALAIYQRIEPEFFVDPVGKLPPPQAKDAIEAGIAMLHTGAQAQGRALLKQALQAIAMRPDIMDGSEWADVWVYSALGEHEQAITALKKGVADGYFLDLLELDTDPLLAKLRSDPRYQQILAPARAKAAAQVAAARAAGLL